MTIRQYRLTKLPLHAQEAQRSAQEAGQDSERARRDRDFSQQASMQALEADRHAEEAAGALMTSIMSLISPAFSGANFLKFRMSPFPPRRWRMTNGSSAGWWRFSLCG